MDITTPINSDKDLADKVEFFIYNKWNIPNTDILKFIKMLENKNSAYIVDAIIKVNELKNVSINTNPTLINSFLSDCLHMLELDNYYTDNFNLDTFNSKYDTLDILFLLSNESKSIIEYIPNINVNSKTYINPKYSKQELFKKIGLDNYIKLLAILLYLHKV